MPEDDHRLVLVSGLRSYSLSNRNQETRKYLEKENNWSLKSNRTRKGKKVNYNTNSIKHDMLSVIDQSGSN